MTSREIRLIVNADDLGRTPGINEGIFAAHERGLVTSATLMVAYPAARQAAERSAHYPDLGIGLHVALTGGPPLLSPRRVPSLVDHEGRLPAKPEGLIDPDPSEVLAEVEAQLERFEELAGRPPTHLDSHHHSQRLPVVGDALIAVARRAGLPVRAASPEVARRLRHAGVATTDAFVERFFGDGARLDALLAILAQLEPGVTELMCHPAVVDDELRQGSGYAEPRAGELAALTHPAAREALDAAGVILCHFGTLAGGTR